VLNFCAATFRSVIVRVLSCCASDCPFVVGVLCRLVFDCAFFMFARRGRDVELYGDGFSLGLENVLPIETLPRSGASCDM